MLKLALAFFMFAIASAILGFGGIPVASASITTVLCWSFSILFSILFVVTLILGITTSKGI